MILQCQYQIKPVYPNFSKRDVTNIQNPPMYSSADNLMHSYIPLEGDRRYGIEEPCGVRNITINFEQIGWMHILAPKVVSTLSRPCKS